MESNKSIPKDSAMEPKKPAPSDSASSPATLILSLSVLSIASTYWFFRVSTEVPDPYLDEVFHVRQAETYWKNQWTTWDPKITTPPGLYALSYLWLQVSHLLPTDDTLIERLRTVNLVGITAIYFVSRYLLKRINSSGKGDESGITASTHAQLNHTALNICLFPPLFFFCAFYYTDVVSVLLVLQTYLMFQYRQPLLVLVVGLASLTFRQTNIFWVALFLGGLELTKRVPRAKAGRAFAVGKTKGSHQTSPTIVDVVTESWKSGELYDPLLQDAWLEDYIKTTLSLGVAGLKHITSIIPALLPYIILLGAFAAFVFVNDGVVLGDKSNHIVSLHLPQMLYIWPYLVFFSFPILIPNLVSVVGSFLPGSFHWHYRTPRVLLPASSSLARVFGIFAPLLAVTLAVIQYNTIVHPFTLADNRHFTFYVFRLLFKHPLIKYIVAPIYLILAWTCFSALGGGKYDSEYSLKSNADKAKVPPEQVTFSDLGSRTSFVIIWAISTALSLITAPLVEPRYFIIPWIIWRLHLPPTPEIPEEMKKSKFAENKAGRQTVQLLIEDLRDYGLLMETAWYLLVNLVVGHVFLNRGFEWPQEKGQVMRFMW